MKAYIEDRNGIRYNFRRLTRKETVAIMSMGKEDNESNYEVIEKRFIEIFKISNPNYNMDLFETEILNYNFEEIGIVNLLKLMSMVVEEVFQGTETNQNKYSFLEENQQ